MVAQPAPSSVTVPPPARPGAGRSSVLPRDPGRATEWLYRRHGDTVFRYAWHLLGRREDAEDATQATFLAAHKALAAGTAVLDSSAWVLRIARNECMGRLRQMARRPAVSLDDGFDPPAAGGVERSAELRDEMRTARETLGGLPEPQREAFVMREWLGLGAGEAALALGMTAGDVDGLASRARRSLVLAVGGLEPAIGCAGTRSALQGGSLDRAAKVHLLRCPVCRGVRRALRPPQPNPRPFVVERLSAAIPGFAGGGGILAALTAKAATAPVLAKTAAIVVATVAAGGAAEQALVDSRPAHHGSSHGGQAQIAHLPGEQRAFHSGAALAVNVTPPPTTHAARTPTASSPARGAAATPTDRHGSSGPGSDDHGGRSGGDTTRSDDNSGSGRSGGESGDVKGSDGERSSTSGKHGAGGGSASSGKGDGGDAADTTSGSGTSGGTLSGTTDDSHSGSGEDTSGGSGDGGTSGSSDGGTSGGDASAPVVTDPALASSVGGGSD
jgi:RNA polymerase sigma factor (sigma-70 family)